MKKRVFPHPVRARLPLLGLFLAATLAALALALMVGSVSIPFPELWRLLWHDDGSVHARILHELRLPRALSAFSIGALLGIAGALMQVLLRNPLADPYVLGVSGGAAVAVLGAMLAGLPLAWHTPVAFAGALASILLLFALAHRGSWNATRLLLTGVVLAAGWSALIGFLLSLAPGRQLPGMLFWLMGDLSDVLDPLLPGLVLAASLAFALALAPALNLATRGALRAGALGVEMRTLRIRIYLLASLLTATAVSLAGAIGFVGLVAPHMVRLMVGGDHRLLLPATALAGGTLLLLADTAARTLVAPMQLPVGVLTALLGVPLFLYLLNHRRGGEP